MSEVEQGKVSRFTCTICGHPKFMIIAIDNELQAICLYCGEFNILHNYAKQLVNAKELQVLK